MSQIQSFKAGSISKCYSTWLDLTSDPEVLSTVKGQLIEFTSTPYQDRVPTQKKFSAEESTIIQSEINKLLQKEVIVPARNEPGQFISTIFLRPKPDGTHRMILNLKQLNKSVEYEHFKMDTLWTVIRMMKPNCYMASIDIKDAYYSVPIAETDQKYLKFEWQGVLYKFTCFPNGLALCPRKFTKLLKPVYCYLRKKGHLSSGYIDDSYLQGDGYQDCLANVVDTIKLFDSLGFIIHPEKSVFIPTQIITFLGFVLDSRTMTVYLTQQKQLKVKNACLHIIKIQRPVIRLIAQLLGLMTSSFPGVMYGPLYYRRLDMAKTDALSQCGDFEGTMELTPPVLEDINWWINNINLSYYVIDHGEPQATLYTDASTTGWGCEFQGTPTGGSWSSVEAQNHINYLEMLAIKLGLKCFEDKVRHQHVKLMVDNMTAVTILNNMGTSHSWKLNELNKEIWTWCIHRGIWLTVAHIPGKTNVVADRESRQHRREIEWTLHTDLYDEGISKLSVKPDIDLFASRLNYRLKPYVSYKPDPGALAVDAFTVQWSQYVFYAFPPFSVIMRVLQKIQQDQATGLVVVPFWPTQTWWPPLTRMLIQAPLVLPKRKNTLYLPQDPNAVHPLHRQMSLLLCHLSGNICKVKEFHLQLPTLLCSPGVPAPGSNTALTLRNGWNTVVNGKLIQFRHL